jgi:putative lipoprotein
VLPFRQRAGSVLALAFALLAACTTAAPRPATVTGTATYRERLALPPEAVFEATLQDVSRVGAPALLLGATRIESPGQVPIRFSIRYDPARVKPDRRYAVRARILLGDTVLFITEAGAPVLGASGATHVDLVLRRAGSPADEPALRAAR